MRLNFLRGPGNGDFDLARFIGASAAIIYPFPYIWNVIAKGSVPDPSAFGVGYAAVLAAIGGMICAKDIGVAKASSLGGGGDAS
jgi:hypothetical protein